MGSEDVWRKSIEILSNMIERYNMINKDEKSWVYIDPVFIKNNAVYVFYYEVESVWRGIQIILSNGIVIEGTEDFKKNSVSIKVDSMSSCVCGE